MDQLTSPQGSVALAIAALLLVLGYRLARPERAREWVAFAAYAVALAAQVLGAQGVFPGAVIPAGAAARVAGAALLVGGLVLAGKAARARRRTVMEPDEPLDPATRSRDAVHAGLALVALGQLLRGFSAAGAAAVLVAMVVNVWVALEARYATRRRGAPERG